MSLILSLDISLRGHFKILSANRNALANVLITFLIYNQKLNQSFYSYVISYLWFQESVILYKMILNILTIFTSAVLLANYVSSAELRVDPLVLINQGLVKGQRATDGDYSTFLGIPYAQVDETNPFGVSIYTYISKALKVYLLYM